MKTDRKRQKILIVDDTPENIAVLVQTLRNQYELSVSVDGRTALQIAASENRPDLILLDIVMPGIDGYEVCKRLKADPATADIPVIFVTAMNEVADEAKGLELGAIDYISKPISPPIVSARVKNHLELKRHRDLLSDLSSVDGLTGIANRRRFNQTLKEEWRRCSRSLSTLSLLMIDIDSFKDFNDHYGHVAGDECIKKIATTLASSTRRVGDLVARYGGEEFGVILPETSRAGAENVAERIRANIAALNIVHAFSACSDRVTVSIGVGSMIPRADSDPEALTLAADSMLYRAKQEGRDCVKSLPQEDPPCG